MNVYYYWYYTIYHIYKKLSRDRDFDLYATGLFSVIIIFSFVGISGFFAEFIGFHEIWFQSQYTLYIYGALMVVFNGFLFLRKKRQNNLYYKYLQKRKVWKDVFVILFSIFFIGLSICYVKYCKETYAFTPSTYKQNIK